MPAERALTLKEAHERFGKRLGIERASAMPAARAAILKQVQRLVSGRPVRWADRKSSAGDFDGRDWTIEVFDVARDDRHALREALWDLFAEARKRTGKSMSLVTHVSKTP